jgi:hypothetical protein
MVYRSSPEVLDRIGRNLLTEQLDKHDKRFAHVLYSIQRKKVFYAHTHYTTGTGRSEINC